MKGRPFTRPAFPCAGWGLVCGTFDGRMMLAIDVAGTASPEFKLVVIYSGIITM